MLRLSKLLLALQLVSVRSSSDRQLYEQEHGWPRGLPDGASEISAVAVDHLVEGKEIYVSQRGPNFPQTILVFNGAGDLVRSWGNDTVTFRNGTFGSHGVSIQQRGKGLSPRLWVFDMYAGKVIVHDPKGHLLDEGGHGGHGTAIEPELQFGNVADGDFGPDGMAYVADGDAGVNNRVVALNSTLPIASPEALVWVAGNGKSSAKIVSDPAFQAPHGITRHPRTGNLFVADRENNRTIMLSPQGKPLGQWQCPGLGHNGTAWGVRASFGNDDLIFVAVADSPEDGAHQFVLVMDGNHVHADKPGPCKVLQTIGPIDTKQCVTPHLMAVDHSSGDLYLACVTADPKQGSIRGLLKYRRTTLSAQVVRDSITLV